MESVIDVSLYYIFQSFLQKLLRNNNTIVACAKIIAVISGSVEITIQKG